MSEDRTVTVSADKDSPVGAWEIICSECPLKPHLEALEMKRRACVTGIQTNIQGAIPLKQCEFYKKDSVRDESGKLSITCEKSAK